MSQDSSFDIVTGYRLDGLGLNPGRGKIFLFSTVSKLALGLIQPSIQWELGHFLQGLSGQGVKLTTHLHLVPRSRMVELYFHSTICLHGLVHNELYTGRTFRFYFLFYG
jgi:hypothetical protein